MSTTVNFPVRLRLSRVMCEELGECELGSFEDWSALEYSEGADDKQEAADMIYGTRHRYPILQDALNATKAKTVTVVMENFNEVAEIYYGACSGTFQIARKDEGGTDAQYRCAVRICDALRPVLRESTDPDHAELLKQWAAPAGC